MGRAGGREAVVRRSRSLVLVGGRRRRLRVSGEVVVCDEEEGGLAEGGVVRRRVVVVVGIGRTEEGGAGACGEDIARVADEATCDCCECDYRGGSGYHDVASRGEDPSLGSGASDQAFRALGVLDACNEAPFRGRGQDRRRYPRRQQCLRRGIELRRSLSRRCSRRGT